jgi:ABC-type nitrate/sulfonate/bicarbonate transport system substrate-binding protein
LATALRPELRVGGVPEHFNLPWRLASADDAFRDTGCTVDYREIAAGTGEMSRALRERELDIALLLTEGAVADALVHDLNRIVKVWVASPLVWGIHVAAKSRYRTPADVRGKRYAISRYGSGSHLIAIVDAAARGWDTENLAFVVVDDIDGARAALSSGEADIFLWEQHMTQPLVDAGEFRRIAVREVPWPAFVVSARRELLAREPTRIRAVLDVASRYALNLQRRSTAAALVAERFGLELPGAEAWMRSVRWSRGYRKPAGALQRATAALRAQGIVSEEACRRIDPWFQL